MSHPPSAEGVVLVDFDGTIFPWGHLSVDKAPFTMAGPALHLLREHGYRIIIFTSRLSPTWHRAEGRDPAVGILEQRALITEAMRRHRLPFHGITSEKIPAVLYLDDKAMRVNEDRDLLDAVGAFLEEGDDAI